MVLLFSTHVIVLIRKRMRSGGSYAESSWVMPNRQALAVFSCLLQNCRAAIRRV